MPDFNQLNRRQRQDIKLELAARYREFQTRNISLDMTRGKPCPEQLDLALEMLNCVNSSNYLARGGLDCRNYGGLDGLAEAKELFARYLAVAPTELMIGGNSSLAMMHDTLMRAMLKGMAADLPPWGSVPQIKFLCPSPGYDRHFFICEYLGLEMVPVQMTEQGPDMDQVEDLVASDARVKGMWCVPMYSNPTGVVYSDEVVERLAGMPTAAGDFRIFWDNAYAVHHLNNPPARLKNILSACKHAGNPDRVFIFGSTSKITFAGAGLALMAGSEANMAWARQQMAYQSIGPDKLNQLRHVIFFKNMAGIEAHMQKHAAILKPKFDAVQTALARELGEKNIAQWTRPGGGYFVSINTQPGCAAAVVKMASEAGVKLTPAGSTYPYKNDPLDRNIRIAPSFPPLADIRTAMELVGICIQRVSIEKRQPRP